MIIPHVSIGECGLCVGVVKFLISLVTLTSLYLSKSALAWVRSFFSFCNIRLELNSPNGSSTKTETEQRGVGVGGPRECEGETWQPGTEEERKKKIVFCQLWDMQFPQCNNMQFAAKVSYGDIWSMVGLVCQCYRAEFVPKVSRRSPLSFELELGQH